LARRRGATELGGLLDFVADFVVYSGFVVGVAIAHPAARLACVVLLAAYLVNNVALLSFSSMIERLGLGLGDERSLRLTTGLAEGTETIVVYVLFCVLPGASEMIAWAFAALVAMTAVQRVAQATRTLRAPSTGDP
jgi:phosphatidylglycerophosphate synthase